MALHDMDRRSILLCAIFPSLAIGLLNQFWLGTTIGLGGGWFFLVDAMQWIAVPALVWCFILHTAKIKPSDFGLDFTPYKKRPLRSLALFMAVAMILFISYTPIRNLAYLFLWKYAGTVGYGSVMPASGLLRAIAAMYLSITAALVEEVVFRGLPWAWLSLAVPAAHRAFWYVALTSLLFAAVHSEQGLPGMIAALSFGIVAALLYLRLRNLWPLVFAHFAIDVLSFWR